MEIKINNNINDSIYIDFNSDIYTLINSYFNKNNKHYTYLQLYKNNNINKILLYITNIDNLNRIINRINISLKTLSKEILNIYFLTRNKNNPHIYNILSENYKNILFCLHKIFILKKKNNYNLKQPINLNNIYNYLKNMNTDNLIIIYKDRTKLIDDFNKLNIDTNNILHINCIYTNTQTKLLSTF